MEDKAIKRRASQSKWKIKQKMRQSNVKIGRQLGRENKMETEDLKKELAEWMDSQLDGKTEEGFESLVDTWGYEE